ncbi:o-succinylbenzoate synthase [Bacillus lacus]|uniref:o-succinylbenzoate synthase n=1 Tax=Metabacillus lacus TaxID=1983721 RepID=A0A7X2LYJ9_9BACI|nr:o-succinylbenzoate synthase [Metabacillus lacus]MRX72426.1 o-succinylbenzoate synthase [Metabacillus lacus]
MYNIRSIHLHHIKMTLKTPFVSSLGTVKERESLLVEVRDHQGCTGWGEAVAFSSPWYTEETVGTCRHMLKDFFIPMLLNHQFVSPSEVGKALSVYRRNPMAKAAIESAYWDLYAKLNEMSLSKLLGGTRTEVEAGVVIGMGRVKEMLSQIEAYTHEGYRRIKIKIKPHQDLEVVKEIREHFPDILLMADANSSYTLNDIQRLQALDEYQLLLIEQPLAADDIIDHASLQKSMVTPICLDESITSYHDARQAVELGSCGIISIKPGRVGGLQTSREIHDFCVKRDVPVWCGGMLETGISRAHNIAVASLQGFTIPGDLSSSSRYWEEDIILPEIKVENGRLKVPETPGIGFEINNTALEKFQIAYENFYPDRKFQ